jgi:hypothetical protein
MLRECKFFSVFPLERLGRSLAALLMTKAEIKDLAPIPAVVIICLNPREARVEVLGMTVPKRL